MENIVWCVVFVIGTASCIDFRRNEAHKYILPNLNGEDICNSINCTSNANFGTVNFYLYNRFNPDIPFLLNEFNIRNINPSLETKVILHGWNEGYNATWVIDMKNTFLSVGDYNIILPDYYYYTSQTIMMGCCYSRSMSEVIGYFLVQLTTEVGLDLKKLHIIGASLGAQVGGIVGDAIKTYTNGIKVARITGLDTTYMIFRGRPVQDRLTPDDADFVDIIHSNSGDMGYPDPHGHVDFYPNCGVTQPQCANETGAIKSLCDHSMSHVFFNRTIYYPTAYVAVECLSCDDYFSGRCSGNRRVIMGESTPTTTRGIYFIEIYDDLRPLIINAINAGEFDDNPPPSLQGNEILEERRSRMGTGTGNDGFGFDFLTTTSTTTTTETPVYRNPFYLSNLRTPGGQYRKGLYGLGSNPDPAGDRLRAVAATSTTTSTTQRSRGNARFDDSFFDSFGDNQIFGSTRRVNRMRGVPSFMRTSTSNRGSSIDNLSVPYYNTPEIKNFNHNAALLGAESKADPYGSSTGSGTSYVQSNINGYNGGYATPSPLSSFQNPTQSLDLPSGNPSVFNERYLANRFNYSLDDPIGPGNLPLGGTQPNQPVYQNSAFVNQQQSTNQNNLNVRGVPRTTYQNSQTQLYQAEVSVWRRQNFRPNGSPRRPSNDYEYDPNGNQQTFQFYTTYNNKK
ncbi:uncharacterized protein LOC108744988 [Agrilus planipennis]|uniref:Uncharacterized protein LOC108744988 n=1 Tax=Agrilus planipennis TaxID=224129 RepID=A0A1W4XK55_AGRPL|nr:uncharacterized protein LOC108744988 [Agrilus planipennis]